MGCALATFAGAVIWAAESDAALVASRSACPGQTNIHAPEPVQEQALRCLIDRIRGGRLELLRGAGTRRRAQGRRHLRLRLQPHGLRPPVDGYAKRFGYTSGTSSWRLGENLAWGKRKRGSARNALKAWLNSPPHRATLLSGSFEHIGVGLKRGRFGGNPHAAVWVLQIGCRGC